MSEADGRAPFDPGDPFEQPTRPVSTPATTHSICRCADRSRKIVMLYAFAMAEMFRTQVTDLVLTLSPASGLRAATP